MSGPFCTRMLADFGAEVIKVESGEGDVTRKNPPFKGGFSGYFNQFNVGKKSIGVNLRHPRGVELTKKLVPLSDVVIENFRPGLMAKMGFGIPSPEGDQPPRLSSAPSPDSVRPDRRRTVSPSRTWCRLAAGWIICWAR